ncbi:helix-turn-helix domain-containing protein [Streptomyces sp. Li-HN-5-11]|uniref:PucR family transcriptional regulator n=1 Tax=Streptomyces sp. Li-HN-5-11 TaxID=3075432 RepID=UPI0028B0521C|nr:helix-turn-helix domain-containing protein [Streptomyces sp. Li-HN-5-11]WNM31726.1 helix-turn-helix domain-containing protein [Streptomyces sp. Li-HN-5-11]
MDPEGAVDLLIRDMVGELAQRIPEASEELRAVILAEIPPLRGDLYIEGMLTASIEENVALILHLMQHRIDLDRVEAPVAAVEWARRLAQRDIPTSVLVRAYRLAHARFLSDCLEELGRRTPDVKVLALAGTVFNQRLFSYVDIVSEQVTAAHERERDRWLRQRAVAQLSMVRALLSGSGTDVDEAEAVLDYPLRRDHLGLVVWDGQPGHTAEAVADPQRVVGELARAVGSTAPLFVPRDEQLAWAWIALPAGRTPPRSGLGEVLGRCQVRVAFGEPAHGVAGFGATHRQAQLAHTAATLGGPQRARATWFAEVGPLALMYSDPDAARDWVHSVLGPLAQEGERFARLRETLHAFLVLRGSFTATGERLMLHKNTVQYRVQKAVECLGRPWEEDTANLELALRACDWFGVRMTVAPSRVGPGTTS